MQKFLGDNNIKTRPGECSTDKIDFRIFLLAAIKSICRFVRGIRIRMKQQTITTEIQNDIIEESIARIKQKLQQHLT